MKKRDRIRQLELEVESYRYAASRLADDIESILTPHRNKNPEATVDAIIKLAAKRHAGCIHSQALH